MLLVFFVQIDNLSHRVVKVVEERRAGVGDSLVLQLNLRKNILVNSL